MLFNSSLTTAEVLAVFTEEVISRDGHVTDTFDDGRRLFTRSILPHVEEVRPGDQLQGGVALKAIGEQVWLYPYLFRLVCRNGAIAAETIESRSLGALQQLEPDTALQAIRDGIEDCCAPAVFIGNVRKMRTACEVQVDLALNLLPWLSRIPTAAAPGLMSQIMDQFFREGDQTQFGLANAVTAVARETRDPEVRWNLEEFGGGIVIGSVPQHPADGGRAALARSDRLVSVG